jgi:molybdopterin-guanine dinucleotide biosynthesis protein A
MIGVDAIVVAGGSGRRLGGADKASITMGAQTLLERALVAVAAADRIIVVGPHRELPESVIRLSEQPTGGGPAAAVVAGLAAVVNPFVVVLACDMPFVTAAHVRRLTEVVTTSELPSLDGTTYVDGDGRRQLLAAIYRTESLRRSARALGEVTGVSMRALAKDLTLLECEADSGMSLDCDTWDDVARSRELLEEA